MTRPDWPRLLVGVSLTAGMALVAQSEIQLALAVGWPWWLAWCAAVSLDGYVMAAVLARKDILPPVMVSAVSVLASHAVYAAPTAWASGVVGQGHLWWPLSAGCSVVPLLVTWRVHNLLERKRQPRVTGQGQGRVKPQVSPPLTPVVTPPVEPARLHSVTSAPDPGGDPIVAQVEWVREQRAAGVRRADVIRAGVTRWGVSESTMIRRWEAAA